MLKVSCDEVVLKVGKSLNWLLGRQALYFCLTSRVLPKFAVSMPEAEVLEFTSTSRDFANNFCSIYAFFLRFKPKFLPEHRGTLNKLWIASASHVPINPCSYLPYDWVTRGGAGRRNRSGTHLSLAHLGDPTSRIPNRPTSNYTRSKQRLSPTTLIMAGHKTRTWNWKNDSRCCNANIDLTALTLDPALVKYASEHTQCFSHWNC